MVNLYCFCAKTCTFCFKFHCFTISHPHMHTRKAVSSRQLASDTILVKMNSQRIKSTTFEKNIFIFTAMSDTK